MEKKAFESPCKISEDEAEHNKNLYKILSVYLGFFLHTTPVKLEYFNY